MLKNSLTIDVLKDCNTFNILTWYPISNDIEFNLFFIFSKNPNKCEIMDYFNKEYAVFNLTNLKGIKELKKYISKNSIHSLFIYGDKSTKKVLKNLINLNLNKKNEDFFTDLYNHSFHLKDIFKNFNKQILDLELPKKIGSIKDIYSIYDVFQEIDQSIQILYENQKLVFKDSDILSLFNYKEFNKYFGTDFDIDSNFKDLNDLSNEISKAIEIKILKEKEILDEIIFIDLEAIDYSSECTCIGLIKGGIDYKKIIKPLKNTKPTKFMIELTGITRDMILKGTLFKNMIKDLTLILPDYQKYKYLVFGVFDKVIWKSSFDSKMDKKSLELYNYIMENFYDFSALTNTYMVDYSITNNNLSLVNSLKFLDVNPLEGIHDPIIDAKNLQLLYKNFFDKKNFYRYIKNNISFYMKKSISSSNFKTLLFCLYSNKRDKVIFEYYLRHKIKENIKNLENLRT